MKIRKLRFIYNSISFKIVIIVLITLIPLTSLLIYYNYKSRETLLQQVTITHRNMIQTSMNQIDIQLMNSVNYNLNMELFQADPNILVSSTDDTDIAFARYRIFADFQKQLLTNTFIDAIFLYTIKGDYFITARQNNVSINEMNHIEKYIIANCKNKISSNYYTKTKWLFTQINKGNYLINLSYGNKDVLVGTYTNTDRILSLYKKNVFSNVKFQFIQSNKLKTINNNPTSNTTLISSKSSIAGISLLEFLPNSIIFNSLPFMQKYHILISIFFFLIIPVLFMLLQFTVVKPLRKLTNSMFKVHNGDINHRILLTRSSNEFEIVNSSFNEMLDEVQNLKINIYEEQLKVQKSQLRNLQSQIKPHFLLNSLNMVYNLIDTKNIVSAKKMILHSVEYFRYMTKVDDDFVVLNEEIKHVATYLEIQKIRYKDKFTYSIDINNFIEDMLIPPMLIQTFVENSIKYALEMNKLLHIFICVEYLEIDYYPYAKITISDTGIGYPSDILDQLNLERKIKDSLGSHIGIYNSVQRIKILYNGKASWKFYNNGGAISELVIPALFESV